GGSARSRHYPAGHLQPSTAITRCPHMGPCGQRGLAAMVQWTMFLFSGSGQLKMRGEPAEGGLAEMHIAAVKPREIAHDRQPEPRARLLTVPPLANVEHDLIGFRRQALSIVLDGNRDTASLRRLRQRYANTTVGMLARIVDEVCQHL